MNSVYTNKGIIPPKFCKGQTISSLLSRFEQEPIPQDKIVSKLPRRKSFGAVVGSVTFRQSHTQWDEGVAIQGIPEPATQEPEVPKSVEERKKALLSTRPSSSGNLEDDRKLVPAQVQQLIANIESANTGSSISRTSSRSRRQRRMSRAQAPSEVESKQTSSESTKDTSAPSSETGFIDSASSVNNQPQENIEKNNEKIIENSETQLDASPISTNDSIEDKSPVNEKQSEIEQSILDSSPQELPEDSVKSSIASGSTNKAESESTSDDNQMENEVEIESEPVAPCNSESAEENKEIPPTEDIIEEDKQELREVEEENKQSPPTDIEIPPVALSKDSETLVNDETLPLEDIPQMMEETKDSEEKETQTPAKDNEEKVEDSGPPSRTPPKAPLDIDLEMAPGEDSSKDSAINIDAEYLTLDSYMELLNSDDPVPPIIELMNQGIDDDDVVALFDKLEQTGKINSVEKILLNGNDFEAGGAERLGAIISKNYPLAVLDIAWNMIGAEGAKMIASGLESNTNLKILVLDGNDLGLEGALALAEHLPNNSGLVQLELKDNAMLDTGAAALCYSLRNHPTLKVLDLTCNSITAGSIEQIAKYLIGNPEESDCDSKYNLETLVLNSNAIDNEGTYFLADSLAVSPTLKSLQLRGCNISTEGIRTRQKTL